MLNKALHLVQTCHVTLNNESALLQRRKVLLCKNYLAGLKKYFYCVELEE